MPIRIPHAELPPATLDALIQEFVTRDGTTTADAPHSVQQVRGLLDAGWVVIVFDEDSESCTIVSSEDADRQGL